MVDTLIIKHDKDGFLVGEKRINDIETKLHQTHKLATTIFNTISGKKAVKPSRVVVSGRIKTDTSAPAPRQKRTYTKRKVNTSTSRTKPVAGATGGISAGVAHPLANQGEKQQSKQRIRQERRHREVMFKSNQVQEKLLYDISKKMGGSGGGGGLLSKLMPMLGSAALMKALFKSPLGLGKLAASLMNKRALGGMLAGGARGFMRGGVAGAVKGGAGGLWAARAGGGAVQALAKPSLLAKGIRGIGRGGLLAALFAGLDGINVEKSNMDRADKNKAHVKNLVVAGGGVAGAAAGATMGAMVGSVVPVVGTAIGAVVGGVLGGVGGSTLAEYFTERVDKAINPNLSRIMFRSWGGFMTTLNWGAYSVWQMLIPEKVRDYFEKLGIDSSTYHSTITGLASLFWESTTTAATFFWDGYIKPFSDAFWAANTTAATYLWNTFVPKQAQDFFTNLWGVAKYSFNKFIEGFNTLFKAIAESTVGQAIGDAWNWTADLAKDVWDAGKTFVNTAASVAGGGSKSSGGDGGVNDSELQKRNDAARRGGNGSTVPSAGGGKSGPSIDNVTANAQVNAIDKKTAAAADFAILNAKKDYAGWCAKYVNDALRSQGFKINGDGINVAKNLINSKQGFNQVKFDANYTPQIGDVMSMPASSERARQRQIKKYGREAGHVAIYTEKGWVSDAIQKKYGDGRTGAASQEYYEMLMKNPEKAVIARRGNGGGAPSAKSSTPAKQNKAPSGKSNNKNFTADKAASIARVAKNIGVDPNDLAAVISFETAGSFSPSIKNPGSSATGLIQFMKGSGGTKGKYYGMSRDEFAALSFDQQMNYVERYFKERGFRADKPQDVASTYTAVTGYGYKDKPKYNKKGERVDAYWLNRVWDSDKNGIIEKGEMVRNKDFQAHQRQYFPNGSNTQAPKKAPVPPAKPIKSHAQQVAVKMNAEAAQAAKVEAQNIKAAKPSGNGTGGQVANHTSGTTANGQIAHAPIKRQVSHPEIANVASGGIMG